MSYTQLTRGDRAQDGPMEDGRDSTGELVTQPNGLSSATFTRVYRDNIKRVYRYCLFRTNSFADAEDIAAETFIRFLSAANRPENPNHILPWLLRTAGNLCINLHRRKTKGALLERRVDFRADETPPWGNEEVWRAIVELKPTLQQVIYLKVVEGLSFDETAKFLGKQTGAVKMAFYRAVKELRRTIKREADDNV